MPTTVRILCLSGRSARHLSEWSLQQCLTLPLMKTRLKVLQSGNSEPLKATVHGLALGMAALCGVYNFSAWLVRRQKHLAINSVLYGAAVIWEFTHVRHHLVARRSVRRRQMPPTEPLKKEASQAAGGVSPMLNVKIPARLASAIVSSNSRERLEAVQQIVEAVCGEWLRQQRDTSAIDERLRVPVEPIARDEHESARRPRIAVGDPRV